jgi:hypothetical protein
MSVQKSCWNCGEPGGKDGRYGLCEDCFCDDACPACRAAAMEIPPEELEEYFANRWEYEGICPTCGLNVKPGKPAK